MDKKKMGWTAASVLIAAFSIWAVMTQSKNFSFAEFGSFVTQADKRWLVMAAICMFGFIFFEGCAICRILRALGYRRNMGSGTLYGAADVYFSAITPSASGGQPASAFFMMRDGIPLTAVTVTLLLNLIMYNAALIAIGGFSVIFRFDLFLKFSRISKAFIGIGGIVLAAMGGSFYLALKKEKILYLICVKVMNFLEKLHILHHAQKRQEKLQHTMKEYKMCSEVVSGQSKLLWEIFFWNLCQRFSQFGVSFMVFKATGYNIKKAFEVWVIQSYVSMGSNCVPIPGSMGVADYLMIDGFTAAIGSEKAVYMELLCRSMSFYGCIITSIMIVTAGYMIGRKKEVHK